MKHCFLGIIFVLLSVSLVHAEMVSISGKTVNMRSGPGKQYPILWELGQGFPLKVIGSQGRWIKVVDFEKDVGWVYRSLTANSPHLIVKVHKNEEQKINIRSGPDTHSDIIGQAYYGVVFKTLKRGNDWVKVRHEDGLTGWVKRSLLWGW